MGEYCGNSPCSPHSFPPNEAKAMEEYQRMYDAVGGSRFHHAGPINGIHFPVDMTGIKVPFPLYGSDRSPDKINNFESLVFIEPEGEGITAKPQGDGP